MEACGMRPGVREYTSLLDACKRAAQPGLAAHVMYHTLPAANLVPDTQAWNALLGAYGRNGDMDSAYATWQVRISSCGAFLRDSLGKYSHVEGEVYMSSTLIGKGCKCSGFFGGGGCRQPALFMIRALKCVAASDHQCVSHR